MGIALRASAAIMLLLFLPLARAAQAGTAAAPTADAAPAAPTFPCEKPPEFHQFDFWVGRWDVRENDKLAGRNWISVREHGCVLVEEWEGSSGSTA
jgi:hypothetical protein